MSTALSMPAFVPVDLLPASAHRLRWDMGDVLRRLVARAAVEQVSNHSAHLSRQLACGAVALQQRVAASTNHHPEAP
ncbi:hypothetical protein [Xanthomonas euvesicatoria]|uniref:hypothetical protein n=1 Tax=Xanthomonas euvesicatoria TaxID=456327 RepID=UPI00210E20A1|nr:hypothetical protein [Xanthomonas euvesicatoria]